MAPLPPPQGLRLVSFRKLGVSTDVGRGEAFLHTSSSDAPRSLFGRLYSAREALSGSWVTRLTRGIWHARPFTLVDLSPAGTVDGILEKLGRIQRESQIVWGFANPRLLHNRFQLQGACFHYSFLSQERMDPERKFPASVSETSQRSMLILRLM